jgi:hypothetical protein
VQHLAARPVRQLEPPRAVGLVRRLLAVRLAPRRAPLLEVLLPRLRPHLRLIMVRPRRLAAHGLAMTPMGIEFARPITAIEI